jgi:hypothetical protein
LVNRLRAKRRKAGTSHDLPEQADELRFEESEGQTAMLPGTIKTAGYLISTLSVILLGIVSWKAASDNLWLMITLLVGMSASVIGMLLRWISYQLEE